MSDKEKAEIDAMSHEELARLWRFAPIGDERLQGPKGFYISERLFKHFGGITPDLSKNIGW